MKIPQLLFLFAISALSTITQAQIPDTINTSPVTELQTVQTPSNTLITALMVPPSTTVYRSTDNGMVWDSVFSYGADATFNATPDPVLTVDSVGSIYLTVMRHMPVTSYFFTAHLWTFKSVDDGLTWNLASTPYAGNAFADYPSITSLGDGRVYLSYTHYGADTSFIRFNRSFDGAVTWTDTSTFATQPGSGWTAVGSDLGWTAGNKLCLSFGDYNIGVVYFAMSNDSGGTWSPVQTIPIAASSTFNITKIVSDKAFSHLGIISHQPHYLTEVYYLTSLDGGLNWSYQSVANSSAYCEGVIDHAGYVNLVYNENYTGTPRLCYRYSTDQGQTFSNVLTLLSWTSVSLTAGEYQSLLLCNDGLFHVTYVDWNEGGAAKHLIFAPLITDIYQTDPTTHAPRIFPNPVYDVLNFHSDNTNAGAAFDVIDLTGKIMMSGTVGIPKTSVNVSSLESGVYLLRVFSGNVIYVQKVVKE